MRVLSLDLEHRDDLPPFQGPRWLPPGTPRHSVRVSDEGVPASAEPYSHLIFSGSTSSILDELDWVPPVMDLVRDAVARKRPILGICFGHQVIVKALLGEDHVRRARTPEMGWLPVRVLPAGRRVFAGLPDLFHVFVGHYDEVCDLPEGWEVIARTGPCEVHGFLSREDRILSFQFHPEMDIEIGNTCFAKGRESLAKHGFDVDRILSAARDDGSGKTLFPRFLTMDFA